MERKFILREPVEKGWSCDKKYCVTDENGDKYLLRITPEEKSASRPELFRMQKEVEALGVPMCRPIEYGRCGEGVYILSSWIEGEDADKAVPRLDGPRQYALGLEAGRILRRIHSIPAPDGWRAWEPRFNEKTDAKIRAYGECPVKFEGAERVAEYINSNRGLLAGRPQTFQHGDYHIGNMMLENGGLVIIDFDRYDFGDPWEEFNRIVWCAQTAPLFASGMVDGYFDGRPPLLFWRLLAFYIGVNTLSSIPWAIPFGEGEVRTMLKQAEDVLAWYDGMRELIPSWYSRRGCG